MEMDLRGKEAIEPCSASTRYLSGRERLHRPVVRLSNHKWRSFLEGQALWALLACEKHLAQQESRFLEVLNAVVRFEISPEGALVLHTLDQGRIPGHR